MIASADIIECADCGAPVDCRAEMEELRVPCGNCGSKKRIYHASIVESVTLRDGIGVKAKRTGEKKPYVEDKGMPSYSHGLGKIVHHERLIDRDNDLYRERVTDYESGEVIHHCEEPLSKHQDHGSAKFRKREDR